MDTGPLSHFAGAGWIDLFRDLAPSRTVVIPDLVEHELRRGAPAHPWIARVLETDWIQVEPVKSEQELAAFGRYSTRLVGDDGRNEGECAVLALAEVRHWTAVLDDAPAVKAAQGRVTTRRTLAVLCDAVQDGLLTPEEVSRVADDLLATQYRLPFVAGGFIVWAQRNGMFTENDRH